MIIVVIVEVWNHLLIFCIQPMICCGECMFVCHTCQFSLTDASATLSLSWCLSCAGEEERSDQHRIQDEECQIYRRVTSVCLGIKHVTTSGCMMLCAPSFTESDMFASSCQWSPGTLLARCPFCRVATNLEMWKSRGIWKWPGKSRENVFLACGMLPPVVQ